jgi:hypothetical protein
MILMHQFAYEAHLKGIQVREIAACPHRCRFAGTTKEHNLQYLRSLQRPFSVPIGRYVGLVPLKEHLRLYTHYFWIFAAEFGSLCLYAIVAFRICRTITHSAVLASKRTDSLRRVIRCIISPSRWQRAAWRWCEGSRQVPLISASPQP